LTYEERQKKNERIKHFISVKVSEMECRNAAPKGMAVKTQSKEGCRTFLKKRNENKVFVVCSDEAIRGS
jgi:hypothetical protein